MSNLGDMIIGGMMVGTTAVTGGASAGAGETVVTGNSSASVQVTNVINADNEGGTAHTIVEKTINGVKEVTEETKHFTPGEPVEVDVNAEAYAPGSTNVESSTTVKASARSTATEDGDNPSDATSTEAEPTPTKKSFGTIIVEAISGLFSSFVGLWR